VKKLVCMEGLEAKDSTTQVKLRLHELMSIVE